MARWDARSERCSSGGGTARRLIGGTLMASGAASAMFFALLTGWFALHVLSEMFYLGLGHSAEMWGVLRVMAIGLLALGTCVLLAEVGRRIMGSRSHV